MKNTPFYQWLRKHDFLGAKMLLCLLLVTATVLLFFEASDKGRSQKLEEQVLIALRRPDNLEKPAGPSWLLPVFRDISALGGPGAVVVVTTVSCGYLLLRRRYLVTALVLSSVICGAMFSLWLKEAIGRPRPDVVPALEHVRMLSFPSTHSMLAAIVYLTLGAMLAHAVPHRATKIYCISVAFVLVILIGFSRVYLGVHYPTDVLAGWCAGAAWALVWYIVYRWLQPPDDNAEKQLPDDG